MDLIISNRTAHWGDRVFDCTIGENGFTTDKREGDGKTPIGIFPFRKVYYRADRIVNLRTPLPLSEITKNCGWCDEPASAYYNQYVQKPFDESHETMWMEAPMYDALIVVGHNDNPAMPNLGSAIFIHVMNPIAGHTKGCIGLHKEDLLYILAQANLNSRLIIEE